MLLKNASDVPLLFREVNPKDESPFPYLALKSAPPPVKPPVVATHQPAKAVAFSLAARLPSSVSLSLSGPEMAEQRPDIHELFCHYNSLYFGNDLGACIVSWAPQLTSTAGTCDCIEEGLCEINLSEPLLKSRSSADLKNILLHEMIHAFLWLKKKSNDHSDHGPDFWNIAHIINSNCTDDDQRPSDGYNITTLLHNEEDNYNSHHWMCRVCGDSIKRGTSREPSPNDCIEKNGPDSDCGNISCVWHSQNTNQPKEQESLFQSTSTSPLAVRHKKVCAGRYEKVDDISGFEDKGKAVEDIEEDDGDRQRSSSHSTRQRLLLAEETKDKRVNKRPRIMALYCSSMGGKTKNSGKKSSQADCSDSEMLNVMDLRTRSLAIGPKIPKQPRTSCKKKCGLSDTEESGKYNKRGREITLVIPLFGVYTDEESEEDPEPLINKRSERRKRMKLHSSDGRDRRTGLTPHEVIALD